MLLNARRRKGAGRKRSTSSRRRTRRTRPILSGAAAWMSAAGSKRSHRARRRRRSVTVKVRRLRGSKRSAVVFVRANPRRRSRRSYRSNPFGGGNLLGQVKGVFSKENLTVAAGGVAATVLTNYLIGMKKSDGSSTLPLPADANTAKAVKVAYALGIPVVGALVTKKFSPSLSKGMLFSGLISGALEAVKQYAPENTRKMFGFSEYLDYTPTSAVGQLPPSYMAASRFASTSPVNAALGNSSAFPTDAWGN